MKCDHVDYDDYFERCGDCHMTGLEIHEEECVPQDDFTITEGGLCDKCGTTLVVHNRWDDEHIKVCEDCFSERLDAVKDMAEDARLDALIEGDDGLPDNPS